MGQMRYYTFDSLVSVNMTVLGCKSVTILWILFRVNHVTAAECDLEKIFRTPKDMSKVNFDHFEIVERNGFERSESTTTTERPLTPIPEREPGQNVAKAQVLLRFGADDGHGSNHIMKIPPQCRHIIGNNLNPVPNFYYPPPPSKYQHECDAHYYHPYPPPVPYVFPNYYFFDNGAESQYLPGQLREYFLRHGEFLDGDRHSVNREKVFIRGRPMTREDVGDYAVRADAKGLAVNVIESPNVAARETLTAQPEVVLLRPRVLKPLNLSDEDIEELADKKTENKRNCIQSPKKAVQDARSAPTNDITDCFIEETRKHKKKSKKSKTDLKDLEKLLNKALVAYTCQNCSGPPKMLISYPITNRVEDALDPTPISETCPYCMKAAKFASDIDQLGSFNTRDIRDDCKCENCQCNKKNITLPGKRFANDIDDLIIVVAEIIDPVGELGESQKKDDLYPEYVPPVMSQIALDIVYPEAANVQSNIPPKPLSNSESYRTITRQGSSSSYNKIGSSPPKMSHSEYSTSSGSGYSSDPFATVFYRAPTEVKTMALEGTLPSQNLIEAPEENASDRDLPTELSGYDFGITPVGVPTCYFFPAPDVSMQRVTVERPLPKYLKVIPRNDLEFVPPRESPVHKVIDYQPKCHRCGRVHSGGNFCDNCGFPAIFYPSANYCPRCPKETRQLNDW